jgi:hypothetical protein
MLVLRTLEDLFSHKNFLCYRSSVLGPGREYDLVVRKSNQYIQRANAIRASLTTPNAYTTSVTPGEDLPEYVILEREAKVLFATHASNSIEKRRFMSVTSLPTLIN